MVKVHSLNQYSKDKGVYYGYSYGKLHVVGMLTGMTTTIINGACGIGINAGHRTIDAGAYSVVTEIFPRYPD